MDLASNRLKLTFTFKLLNNLLVAALGCKVIKRKVLGFSMLHSWWLPMASLKTFLKNLLHLSQQLHCDWLASLWDHRTRHSVRSLCRVTESLVTILGPTASGQASKIIWTGRWSPACHYVCIKALMLISHHEHEFWPGEKWQIVPRNRKIEKLEEKMTNLGEAV